METITNAASAAATTVSSLIYGQPAKNSETSGTTTASNETAGKEPVSGEQGKGTVVDPFDKGNAEEDPANTTSKTTDNTSQKADDFLPLNPTVESGATEKTGTSDKVYKETPLDDIKLSGAPGAGPAAPDYTPATPETNVTSATSDKPTTSTSDKPAEHSGAEVAKDSTSSATPKETSSSKKEGVDSEIDAILKKTPVAEHSVDDHEAESPHAKMTNKTVRQTEASKPGEGGEPKSLVAETSGHKSDSRKSSEQASSPSGGDEKSSKKISALKDKLKDKLHIGSKDK